MKFVFGMLFLVRELIGPLRPILAADSKASWQAEWNRRYGQRRRKARSRSLSAAMELLSIPVCFKRLTPRSRLLTLLVPEPISRSVFRRSGGPANISSTFTTAAATRCFRFFIRQDARPDQVGFDSAGSHRRHEMVGGQTKIRRQRRTIYFCLRGQCVGRRRAPAYNTQLLDPREYKSYWDFLNPKLKGKIISTDIRKVRGAGIPWQFLYYHPDLGPKYLRRLFGEMDVTMSADLRQAVDWLGTGKFALGLPIQGGTIYKAKNQGLPVDQFESYHFKEGVNLSSAFGSLALMNRAPHPNAAKVFINWLLSREGQTLFQKVISVPGDARNSRRIDVPKDHIPPDEQRRDKMPYFDTDDPDTKDLTPAMKLLDEILVPKNSERLA